MCQSFWQNPHSHKIPFTVEDDGNRRCLICLEQEKTFTFSLDSCLPCGWPQNACFHSLYNAHQTTKQINQNQLDILGEWIGNGKSLRMAQNQRINHFEAADKRQILAKFALKNPERIGQNIRASWRTFSSRNLLLFNILFNHVTCLTLRRMEKNLLKPQESQPKESS